MHLVTAKSQFEIVRYGEWLPRPSMGEDRHKELIYLNTDVHSPLDKAHPFKDDCWVKTYGNEIQFWMADYRRYTKMLAWMFLGADTHEIRKDLAGYYGKPFVEQLGSAIYATVLGPETATKLFQDYTTHRDHFHACLKQLDLNAMDWGRMEGSSEVIKRDLSQSYDNWIRAFAIASETGIVLTQYQSPKTLL